jgi:hypothetical protein
MKERVSDEQRKFKARRKQGKREGERTTTFVSDNPKPSAEKSGPEPVEIPESEREDLGTKVGQVAARGTKTKIGERERRQV